MDLRAVLEDPVAAGDPRVEHPLLDVPRHLLGPDQEALDLGVVDLRVIRARRKLDVVSRLAKELARRLLQAAGGDPQFQNVVGHESGGSKEPGVIDGNPVMNRSLRNSPGRGDMSKTTV